MTVILAHPLNCRIIVTTPLKKKQSSWIKRRHRSQGAGSLVHRCVGSPGSLAFALVWVLIGWTISAVIGLLSGEHSSREEFLAYNVKLDSFIEHRTTEWFSRWSPSAPSSHRVDQLKATFLLPYVCDSFTAQCLVGRSSRSAFSSQLDCWDSSRVNKPIKHKKVNVKVLVAPLQTIHFAVIDDVLNSHFRWVSVNVERR